MPHCYIPYSIAFSKTKGPSNITYRLWMTELLAWFDRGKKKSSLGLYVDVDNLHRYFKDGILPREALSKYIHSYKTAEPVTHLYI